MVHAGISPQGGSVPPETMGFNVGNFPISQLESNITSTKSEQKKVNIEAKKEKGCFSKSIDLLRLYCTITNT